MIEQLKSSVVRVINSAGRVVGAGFLAGDRTVVTCAHVVAQAIGIPDTSPETPSDAVTVDFPLVAPGRFLTAAISQWMPVKPTVETIEDIAILTLHGDPPQGANIARLLDASDLWGHRFRAFGFPASHDNGVWAQGLLRDRQSSGWIQIEDDRGTGYFVAPGFSGTPIYDEVTNAIVGMAVVADRKAEVRAAFIIPAGALLSVAPALAPHVQRAASPAPAPAPPQPPAPEAAPFWMRFEPPTRGFHRGERESPKFRPEVLLVMIDDGSADASWEAVAPDALASAKVDIDVMLIDWPLASFTQEAITDAARELAEFYAGTFEEYRHLIFVARNTELLVKQLLLDDAVAALDTTSVRTQLDTRLACRTRNIILLTTGAAPDSEYARELVQRFRDLLARYDRGGLPTPAVHEAAKFRKFAGRFSPESMRNPITTAVAERLAPFRWYASAGFARGLMSKTAAMDPQVRMLFGLRGTHTGDIPLTGESQMQLARRLTTAGVTMTNETLIVVNGAAGVGKSVLMRVVDRKLAAEWLRGTPGTALPIPIPLTQFKIDIRSAEPRELWQKFIEEWLAYVNDEMWTQASEEERQHRELITFDAAGIHEHLQRSPAALLFDGVDEFLLNHPQLSLTDFAAFLRFLLHEYAKNTDLLVIVAVRSSTRGLALLADSTTEVLTLRRMQPSEAMMIFPGAMSVVEQAPDPAVQDLLFTPLILSTLEKSRPELSPDVYLNRSSLLHAALSAVLTTLKRAWPGRPYSTTTWIHALSVIAWHRQSTLRGEIDDEVLAQFAAETVERWTAGAKDGAAAETADSFRLLLDPAARAMLLRHSIFFPVRETSYRLMQREWGDYLVAHYAVLCLRHQQFDDLASAALNHDIYIMAGQQLLESDTDRDTVRALVERAKSGGRFLILGNFAQMLGASFAPITPDVLDREILAQLYDFPQVVRFAFLSALGSRVLLGDKRDPWSRHLRPVLLRTLTRHAADAQENTLIRSMCACFLRVLTDGGGEQWSDLWSGANAARDALSMIATQAGGETTVNDLQRSIQRAFMRIQTYVAEIPSRAISAVHYLYPLVLAYQRQVPLDRTVVVELPSLLNDERIDAVYREHPVPVVATMWRRCRELFEETDSTDPLEAVS